MRKQVPSLPGRPALLVSGKLECLPEALQQAGRYLEKQPPPPSSSLRWPCSRIPSSDLSLWVCCVHFRAGRHLVRLLVFGSQKQPSMFQGRGGGSIRGHGWGAPDWSWSGEAGRMTVQGGTTVSQGHRMWLLKDSLGVVEYLPASMNVLSTVSPSPPAIGLDPGIFDWISKS